MIKTVRVTNFRSIANSEEMYLGEITLLIGANNSGKSAFLRAMYAMQNGQNYTTDDNRIRGGSFSLEVKFSQPVPLLIQEQMGDHELAKEEDLTFNVFGNAEGQLQAAFLWNNGQGRNARSILNATSPDHLIVPIFARRKPDIYETALNENSARTVSISDRFISSRLSNLNGEFPEAIKFRELVQEVLPNVKINTHLVGVGHQAGTTISSHEAISLDRMGEGVSSVLRLLMEFALSGERVYLIEEPENDLHPEALLKVVNLIRKEVENGSQFVISTHSDLVLRHLGSVGGAKIYRTQMAVIDSIPTTTFAEVSDAFDRGEILSEMGYLDTQPNAWLLFEESSAEKFIGKGLIPLLFPKLGSLRTISSKGASKLEPYYEDLYRTTLFTHLHPDGPHAYVLADGDQAGKDAIEKLKEAFPRWDANRFRNLLKTRIEDYYPDRFRDKIQLIDEISDSFSRSRAKGSLASEVVEWIRDDIENAQIELEICADEIITWLREIENEVKDLW